MNINIQPLINISRKGSINFHYATGVVTAKNSGFLTTGYNDNIQAFMDFKRHKHHCSAIHAEQTAATKLCNKITSKFRDGKKRLSSKDLRRKIKKYKLITIRSRKNNETNYDTKNIDDVIKIDEYDIIDASPCRECVKFLLNIGITTVYFTTDNKIVKMKLNELEINKCKVSDAQKAYLKKRYNK